MNETGDAIRQAVNSVDRGRWLVGVSGGADSVALLLALHAFRSDIELVVAHLDHQSRGAESDGDCSFVVALSQRIGVPIVVRRLDECGEVRHPNLETRYRLARHKLFEIGCLSHATQGVLLAQHADDRAETTLMRLLRHSDPIAVDGLRRDSQIGPVRVCRPLIGVRRDVLRRFLHQRDEPWREDSSNQSGRFARNRVRHTLKNDQALTNRMLAFADATRAFRDWVVTHAPTVAGEFAAAQVADAPDPLARHAVRTWLRAAGIQVDDIAPAQIEQIISLTRDRATAASVNLPGDRRVRRKRETIEIV